MNKQLTILATALLLGATTSAFASSTDLTVTGTITPGACTPTLAGGGIVDYGKISAKDLNPTSSTHLDEKTLQLTVACDAPTQFAIVPTDNRTVEPSTMAFHFGLGPDGAGTMLGVYELRFQNLTAAGTPTLIRSNNAGTTWAAHSEATAIPRDAWMAGGTLAAPIAPIDIQDLTLDISVRPIIKSSDSLDLTNDVELDGSATLQIVYL